jgi:glycine cleavage system H protein
MGRFDLVRIDVPILSPVSGVIQEINDELISNLWLLDSDPYGEGWLALVSLTGFAADRERLLDAQGYLDVLREAAKSSMLMIDE